VVGQIAVGISDGLDLGNPATLLDAIIDFNIGASIGLLILYALTGFSIVWVAKREPAIEDVADRTKLNKI
jgi:type IV secretory pathway TrbD component